MLTYDQVFSCPFIPCRSPFALTCINPVPPDVAGPSTAHACHAMKVNMPGRAYNQRSRKVFGMDRATCSNSPSEVFRRKTSNTAAAARSGSSSGVLAKGFEIRSRKSALDRGFEGVCDGTHPSK